MSKKQKSLIGGISILSIAGLICKMIGVLYKIPLAKTIGSLGMGVYHQVFPTYNLLLTISSVGIPVAISRMVAARLAKGDSINAKRVFKFSLIILTAFGLLGTLIMFAFSEQFAIAKGTHFCRKSYIAISPSLLIVCVMSAYRGYMQGRRRMFPTAISQLIEQVGKVAIAMPISSYLMRKGDYALGAAGAMLGVSLAEALALLYMFIDERIHNSEFDSVQSIDFEPENRNSIIREVLVISIPITIGACIVPIAGEIDSYMLVKLMKAYISEEEALIHYGTYTGLVFPLINVPTALAMATAINLVPAISNAISRNDFTRVQKEANTGLRFASVIGIPASIGMSLLSGEIISVLFSGDKYTQAQLALGGELLSISALTIFLFTQVQTTSGILQGLNKQRIPMYTLAVGVVLKIITNYNLIRIPGINIHGAPFASIICYTASLVPNLYYVKKYTNLKINIPDLLLRPLLASGVMAGVILLFKFIFKQRVYHSFVLLSVVIVLALISYVLSAFVFKAVRKDDLKRIK